jgi:molybdopterin-binding protein
VNDAQDQRPNQLVGRVIEVHKGQTTAQVKVDLGYGLIITAEAIDDLNLAEDDIRASDVMIGK